MHAQFDARRAVDAHFDAHLSVQVMGRVGGHLGEATVGIGLNYPLLHGKYARFHWLLNINLVNPT